MTALDNGSDPVVPTVAAKPRKPREGGLTYTTAELCYALGMSPRQLRRLRHRLPAPLPFSRRPLWSREVIAQWIADGGKSRR